MALNGSVSVEATRGGNDDLVFSWEAVQDQSTMTSTISWKLELLAYAYGRIEQSTPQPWTVTIDGQEFSGTASVNIANNETKQLAAGEIVLTHNEDGTRSFAFTFSQELNITWGASSGNPIYIGAVTGEGTGELDPLEAPEPEPQKFPIKKWLAGLIAALCSPRRAFPQREPIGYLYGHIAKEGEELSSFLSEYTVNGDRYIGIATHKLTEYDEKTWPYLIIYKLSTGIYYARAFLGQPLVYYSDTHDAYILQNSGYPGVCLVNYIDLEYSAEWGEWNEQEIPAFVTLGIGVSSVVFANFDVTYKTETLLKASGPIPVYE